MSSQAPQPRRKSPRNHASTNANDAAPANPQTTKPSPSQPTPPSTSPPSIAQPSEQTQTYNTAASSSSVASTITEMYCDPSPTPTQPSQTNSSVQSSKSLGSDLSYAMTSLSSSHDYIFQPGTMAMANGQVVHILSTSIDENTNVTSYAVRTARNDVFITSHDTLTVIPTLPPKSVSTSSTSASTRSSKSRGSRSRRHPTHPPRIQPTKPLI